MGMTSFDKPLDHEIDELNSNIANKLDTANVYNGLDKTASGFALDARQGKALNDKIGKKILIKELSGTANASGGYSTGLSTGTNIILGVRLNASSTNGHFDWDAYGGNWWLTGLPSSAAFKAYIAYITY